MIRREALEWTSPWTPSLANGTGTGCPAALKEGGKAAAARRSRLTRPRGIG